MTLPGALLVLRARPPALASSPHGRKQHLRRLESKGVPVREGGRWFSSTVMEGHRLMRQPSKAGAVASQSSGSPKCEVAVPAWLTTGSCPVTSTGASQPG